MRLKWIFLVKIGFLQSLLLVLEINYTSSFDNYYNCTKTIKAIKDSNFAISIIYTSWLIWTIIFLGMAENHEDSPFLHHHTNIEHIHTSQHVSRPISGLIQSTVQRQAQTGKETRPSVIESSQPHIIECT